MSTYLRIVSYRVGVSGTTLPTCKVNEDCAFKYTILSQFTHWTSHISKKETVIFCSFIEPHWFKVFNIVSLIVEFS